MRALPFAMECNFPSYKRYNLLENVDKQGDDMDFSVSVKVQCAAFLLLQLEVDLSNNGPEDAEIKRTTIANKACFALSQVHSSHETYIETQKYMYRVGHQ